MTTADSHTLVCDVRHARVRATWTSAVVHLIATVVLALSVAVSAAAISIAFADARTSAAPDIALRV